MKALEQKRCSNCGDNFICGPEAGEEKCWCDQLSHLSLVANEDQDCFCPKCLRLAIQELAYANSRAPVGFHRAMNAGGMPYSPVEGDDYYFEGEAIVFTEQYHLRRGHCCESRCRHCPYRENLS